jgi:alanine dehydrogenase
MLVLSRGDVSDLLSLRDCVEAVEEAFRLHAEGRTYGPGVLGVHVAAGGFHIKAAGLVRERSYFAAKVNGNFSGNPRERGLPAIQGVIVLADADTGTPLAIMDSIEITALRTAATTALAARWLSRPGASTLTVIGCGVQGRYHVRALAQTLAVERIWLYDVAPERARALADEMATELTVPVLPVTDVAAAIRHSDVCVTCTPAHSPVLGPADLHPGLFIGAVGADNQDKQELEPQVLADAGVVVDHLEQCATIGELHHALDRGLLSRADVRAELWEVVTGRRPGRLSADEVVVFDSTGTALQDVAAAATVYERALERQFPRVVEAGRATPSS